VDPLIDVMSLARSLAAGASPVLLDVRWRLGGPPGIIAYRAGHLPGAVFVDLDRDLSAAAGPDGRHPLPGTAAFQLAMRRAGVSDGQEVVVYDEADATAAARCWWLLRYFGHARVRVLDGGYRAWAAAGQPAQTGEDAAARPGDFTARPGGMPLLDADGAAGLARQGTLLDARAGERYRGEVEPVDPVAGHIPGALSAPTTGNLLTDGRFLPAPGLRARFSALGVAAGAGDVQVMTGAYCGSGVTAAHEVLALAMAGIPAALYAGSWSHWVTDPARPVATGPEPG
jgi:thiosulfate/3-mercaptopyruvate sulfurtransferase